MRKSEFVAATAKVADMSQKDVEKVLDAMSTVVVDTVIEKGDEVHFPFGIFKQKINPAKNGVNPLTKKPMNVPESHTMTFKASKTVKKFIETASSKKAVKNN